MQTSAGEVHEAAAEMRERRGSSLRERREHLPESVPFERGGVPVSSRSVQTVFKTRAGLPVQEAITVNPSAVRLAR